MSQEVVENQTDPENHLQQPHPSPHSPAPLLIIILSPPTVMNSLPISLYSHTLCSGTSLPPRPLLLGTLGAEHSGAQTLPRNSSLNSSSRRHVRRLRVTPLRQWAPAFPVLHDAIPLYHSDTSSLYLIPILQSSETLTAPGSRMALQPHPRSTVQQSRAHGSPLTPAGHQPLGPDDDPSTNEGRGTPHETTEGHDQDTSCWSDHSNPFHKQLVFLHF